MYLTQEGIEKLKKQLEQLKLKRKDIAKKIEEAKKFGDLSENAEYMEAREAQEFNERKIAEIKYTILGASVIKKSGKKDIVQIGSTLKAKVKEKSFEFTIVGSGEVDIPAGKISNESPLGMAFLGHKVGDRIKVKVPAGEIEYKILEIS